MLQEIVYILYNTSTVMELIARFCQLIFLRQHILNILPLYLNGAHLNVLSKNKKKRNWN